MSKAQSTNVRKFTASEWKKFMAIMSDDKPNAALKKLMRKPKKLTINLK
jgi:uncharacterized protein (DUF1778 family)